jgi:hypothetical protein
MYSGMEAWPQRANKLPLLNGHCPNPYALCIVIAACVTYFSTRGGSVAEYFHKEYSLHKNPLLKVVSMARVIFELHLCISIVPNNPCVRVEMVN